MKKFIELIKEIYKMPRGKAIIFFSFYFLVFLILVVVLRFNNEYKPGKYDESKEYSFNSSSILSNNYHFSYTVTVDGKKKVYEGDRNETEELFTVDGGEYYLDNNKYYKKEDIWKEVENPYSFNKFMVPENILNLVNEAFFESKVSYQSGQNKYNFLISTNTLNKVLEGKDTDVDDEANTIMIGTDENNYLNQVTYTLDSYCLYTKSCKKSLKIELNYEKFGEIKKIKSPIA